MYDWLLLIDIYCLRDGASFPDTLPNILLDVDCEDTDNYEGNQERLCNGTVFPPQWNDPEVNCSIIEITLDLKNPINVEYSTNELEFYTGIPGEYVPIVQETAVGMSFSIVNNLPLPLGLFLDSKSGRLYGNASLSLVEGSKTNFVLDVLDRRHFYYNFSIEIRSKGFFFL